MDFSQPLPFIIDSVEENISNEEYHSHGSEIISSSFVKGVCKSGSVGHALIPFEGNEHTEFGTYFHDLMEMSKKEFNASYTVFKESKVLAKAFAARGDKETKNIRATKEYKDALAEEKSMLGSKVAIKEDQWDALQLMKKNTEENEAYKSLFQFGKPIREWSVFGSLFGIRCRVRFDMGFCNGNPSIKSLVASTDYKTCQSLQDFEADLNRSVKYKSGWRYDVQAVFYSDFLGIDPSNFYFTAVEKKYPYSTGVYGLSQAAIERAREDVCIAMDKIAVWKETGELGNIKNEIIRI